MEIPKPKSYLESHYKNGIALSHFYVDRSVVNQLDGVAADAVTSESWVDVMVCSPYFLIFIYFSNMFPLS